MRRPLIALLVAIVATLLFSLGFWQRWFPLGVTGQWTLPRLGPWDPPIASWRAMLPAAIVALALAAFIVWSLPRVATMRSWLYSLTLVAIFLLGGAFQLFLELAAPTGLHKWATLYHVYREAARMEFADVRAAFENHAAVVEAFEPNHVSANPAGWIIIYRALLDFFDAHPQAANWVCGIEPNEMAWTFRQIGGHRGTTMADQATITVVALASRLAALCVCFPVAWLVRQRYDRPAALLAGAISLLIPSASLHAPWVDTVYPTFAALIVALSYHASAHRRWLPACAAGALVGVGMFFSLSFVVVAALAATFVLYRALQGHRPTGASMAAAVAGWLLVILVLAVVFHHRVWESWQVNLAKNQRFNQNCGCPYAIWVWVNLFEFAVAMGIPASVFLVFRSFAELVELAHRRRVDAFWAALITTIVMLDLAGTNRGEVSRLWLFFMPMVAALAVELLPLAAGRFRAIVASLLLLQAACCIMLSRELIVVWHWAPHDTFETYSGASNRTWATVRRLTEEEYQRRQNGQ